VLLAKAQHGTAPGLTPISAHGDDPEETVAKEATLITLFDISACGLNPHDVTVVLDSADRTLTKAATEGASRDKCVFSLSLLSTF